MKLWAGRENDKSRAGGGEEEGKGGAESRLVRRKV